MRFASPHEAMSRFVCEAVEPEHKTCSKCGIFKSLSAYGPGSGWHRVRADCRGCISARVYAKRDPERVAKADRKSLLKRCYGLSLDDYDQMLEQQRGVCGICGGTDPDGRRLAVDHCHATGNIRGLLCGHCNRALGLLGDCPTRIRAAAAYIEKAK